MRTLRSASTSRKQRLFQGLQVGVPVAVLLLLMWSASLFAGGRLRLINIYFVDNETSQHIVIVGLDDASLKAYGRSPMAWDRHLYADLITRLNAGGARVIAFDLLFAESSEDDAVVAEAIQQVRSGDIRTRTVLAAAGVGVPQLTGQDNQSRVMRFDNVLHPVDTLSDAVDYIGYVNTLIDTDGAIRRQSSLVQIDGDEAETQPALSFSLATYLAYLRIPVAAVAQLVIPDGDYLQVTPDRRLPVDTGGLWLQNYYGSPGVTFPVISMRAVLDGEIPPTTFDDKIVLIGIINTEGATDRYFVPSSTDGQPMAGVEVQAHAIETLIRNQPVTEQSTFSQIAMIVLLSIGSALLYAWMRWYWKLTLALVLVVALVVIASVNFSLRFEEVNLFHGGLALILPVIASTGLDITTERRQRQQTEFLLASVVDLAGQQLETDKILLRIAEDVQRILPASTGRIEVYQGSEVHRYEFPAPDAQPIPQPLIEEAASRTMSVTQSRMVVIPMVWQQRTIGVIAAQTGPGKRLDARQRLMLEDLAHEIAPGLENAILYHETQRQQKLSQAILNGSPTYTAILNGDYHILQANEVFNQRLQSFLPNLQEKNLLRILTSTGLDAANGANLQRQSERRKAFRSEIRLGNETFNVYATLLADYEIWVVVFSDVTALAELNRLKTQMIRMASHDLKNPLSGVLGYSNLLMMDRDQLSAEHQRFVDLIQQAGETMLNIINDILNLEQLRSTEMPEERVSLNRLVYDVISRHEPEMTLKRQHFKLEVQRGLPEMIGRPTQLAQVISNLLGNASKYTPSGGSITLRLYLIEPDTLRLEVQDTGYGIPKDAQQKLFTEFYRVKTAETASIPGTGLGLSLVKSVVEAHHGHIRVESEEKVGSTFYVEFLAAPQTETGSTLSTASSESI